MSIQFSDTTTKKGIVQFFEKEIGVDFGVISDNSTKLKSLVADINVAHDELLEIGFKSSGMWQLDDSNHTDYPEIRTNLVSGQRDYTFLTDGSGNLILDIYRVMIADQTGTYRQIDAVDREMLSSNLSDTDTLINGQNETGIPTRYNKTANGIFLDLIPNYNYTNGLKVYINREGSYFTSTDTTKKPGVPGTLHKWYYLRPAQEYARRNNLAIYNTLTREVELMKLTIESVFGRRERDIKRRLQFNQENTR